jgi:hypothetical protein
MILVLLMRNESIEGKNYIIKKVKEYYLVCLACQLICTIENKILPLNILLFLAGLHI